MFPKIAAATGAADHDTDHLVAALTLTGGAVGTGVLGLAMASRQIIRLFFGSAYTEIASLLPWYAAAIGAFSLAFVILNASLARGSYGYPIAFAVGTTVYIGLTYLLELPPQSIVLTMGVCYVAILGLGLVMMCYSRTW